MKLRLALFSLTIFLLAGCGTPGAPLPPSLHLPTPVTDLKAERKGDKVTLTWTAPVETTDGQGIRSEGTVLVCRALQTPSAAGCREKVGQLPLMPANTQANRRQVLVDDLGPAIAGNDPRDFFIYNVIAANGRGRSAGPSNPATVFLAPSVAPLSLDARVVRGGVELRTNIIPPPPTSKLRTEYSYRFTRNDGTNTVVLANGPLQQGEPLKSESGENLAIVDRAFILTDTTMTWERPYTYTVTGITRVLSRDGSKILEEFEGEVSAPLKITPHDIFPPAAPQAVQAVYSTGFIDLAWHPNTESDIAGYNVYRGDEKLNVQPVTASAFRDDKLQGIAPGAELVYYVTAVDTQGNESPRSQSATERIPKP
jgi:hypothetical protein